MTAHWIVADKTLHCSGCENGWHGEVYPGSSSFVREVLKFYNFCPFCGRSMTEPADWRIPMPEEYDNTRRST